MTHPPPLILFNDFPNWPAYVDFIYKIYLRTVVDAKLMFQGHPIKVKFIPLTKHKAFGFWHLISEAPSQNNRNEDDRIPDTRRCERIGWVAWCIQQVEAGSPEFSWWENNRKNGTNIVIWAEKLNFVVILGKRQPAEGNCYYLLLTAYCPHEHNCRKFRKERDKWRAAQND